MFVVGVDRVWCRSRYIINMYPVPPGTKRAARETIPLHYIQVYSDSYLQADEVNVKANSIPKFVWNTFAMCYTFHSRSTAVIVLIPIPSEYCINNYGWTHFQWSVQCWMLLSHFRWLSSRATGVRPVFATSRVFLSKKLSSAVWGNRLLPKKPFNPLVRLRVNHRVERFKTTNFFLCDCSMLIEPE